MMKKFIKDRPYLYMNKEGIVIIDILLQLYEDQQEQSALRFPIMPLCLLLMMQLKWRKKIKWSSSYTIVDMMFWVIFVASTLSVMAWCHSVCVSVWMNGWMGVCVCKHDIKKTTNSIFECSGHSCWLLSLFALMIGQVKLRRRMKWPNSW